jgi:phosphate binding protein
MRTVRSVAAFVIIAAALLLGACGTPAPTQAGPTSPPPTAPAAIAAPATSAGMLPAVDPAQVQGDIIMAGSSTVFPLAERMAEVFGDEGYGGNITIDSIGSGAGFERFCKTGESDISNASRAIRDSEIDDCRGIGREPIEFRIGTDALSVTVSQENDFLTGVTKEQLAHIFSDAVLWSDVDPSWPAEPIQRFSPGTDSGTFDYFVEAVMNPVYVSDATADAGKGEQALLDSANLQLSEDDNVLVAGVESSPYAIGYFGFAYYNENAGRLKALSIDGVAPDAVTAENGQYPLARPLFLYSDGGIMAEKPQVAAFLAYFLAYVDDEILDVGYFPASAEAIEASMQAWLDAQP